MQKSLIRRPPRPLPPPRRNKIRSLTHSFIQKRGFRVADSKDGLKSPPGLGNNTSMTARERVAHLLKAWPKIYPHAHCELDFRNPLELLVATILSAQSTDRRVNMVTPALFRKYRTAKSYADAPLPELENAIKSTGFYRNKAKSIRGAMS